MAMEDKTEHMRILEMIESGKISVEEGLGLLAALDGQAEAEKDELLSATDNLLQGGSGIEVTGYGASGAPDLSQALPPPSPLRMDTPGSPGASPGDTASAGPEILVEKPPASLPPDAAKWRRWWVVPLWIGVGFTVLGSLLLYAAVQSAGGVNFWFFCASIPFTLGLLAIILAWQSRSSPWLHLRVQQAPGETPQRIAISMPLPIRFAAWFLRTFKHKIPAMQDQALDEMILAVGRNASPENPIYIQVDEGEDGEKVEIYIG
jgi:hypothetical protein